MKEKKVIWSVVVVKISSYTMLRTLDSLMQRFLNRCSAKLWKLNFFFLLSRLSPIKIEEEINFFAFYFIKYINYIF